MLDSCRLHTDNDHANDVAADPEEARVEACPSTEYTKDASKRATHRAPLTPQYHGKHTVRPFRQAPKKSPNRNRLKQTSQSYTRKSEGVSQQENRTPESPTVCSDPETACTRPPRGELPDHDRDSPVRVAVSTEERAARAGRGFPFPAGGQLTATHSLEIAVSQRGR